MTIGQDPSNQIVLQEDAGARRTHAQVDRQSSGLFTLTCVDPGATIESDGQLLQQLELRPDLKFRIAQTSFECHSGEVTEGQVADATIAKCPWCTSTVLPEPTFQPTRCSSCAKGILVIEGKPRLILPEALDDYHIERFVARGGMGVLVLARDKTGKRVAIKVLPQEATADPSARQRFQAEYAALTRVAHPRVLRPIGHGEVAGIPYLVTEWVEGTNLRDVVEEAKRTGALPKFSEVLRWFVDTSEGLAAIHDVGLVHRDIKPSNILLLPDGHAIVADLGIAKSLEDSAGLTMTSVAPGTFDYMAPEQHIGSPRLDERADQYSLGVTFYEALTGRKPTGTWADASAVNRSVPTYFDGILKRLLLPFPESRYPSVEKLLDELRAVLEVGLAGGGSITVPEVPPAAAVPISAIVMAGILMGSATGSLAALWLNAGVLAGAMLGAFIGALAGRFVGAAR
ncbi:MAG TPA: serine/threonine-protein kinase [Pirellulales bacterium]|nr:serine/threonine-protein kinase [Pirellulales bacterium]